MLGELRGVDRDARRGDRDQRVDRRHHVAHVAHVGAAHHVTDDRRIGERASQRGRVAVVPLEQARVRHHVVVGRVDPASVHGAARRPGTCVEALQDPLLERLEPGDRRGPHVPLRGGVTGHHVGLLPRVGEDAVHPFVVADVLAQRGDVDVAEDRGVERVAAQVRCRRGVRRDPVVLDDQALDRQRGQRRQVVVRRVDHHRDVDVVERAVAQHEDLPAAALFGRGAQDPQATAELLCERRGGQAGTEPGGGDDVVATGVADARQGVVLADHRDGGALGADARAERRVEPVRVARRRDAVGLEHVAEQVVRVVLGEAQLRVVEDAVGHVEQELGAAVDLGEHRRLGVVRVGRQRVTHAGQRRWPLRSDAPARSCPAGSPSGAARAPAGTPTGAAPRR